VNELTYSMNLQPANMGCLARRPYVAFVVVTLKMYKEAKQKRNFKNQNLKRATNTGLAGNVIF